MTIALTVVLAWEAAGLIDYVWRFGTDVPIGDDWDLLRTLLAWKTNGITMQSLLAFHNEHRIVATRLLFNALLPTAGGNLRVAMLFNAGLAIITLAIVATFFRRTRAHSLYPFLTFAAVASLVCGRFQWQNLLWSFQLPWLLLPLLLVGCLWALSFVRNDRLCATVVASLLFVSVCCQANGIVVWVAVIPAVLLRNSGWSVRRRAAFVAGMGILCAGVEWLYFVDLPSYVARPSAVALFAQPIRFSLFFVSALGSPFSAPLALFGPERWIGATVGSLALLATLVVLTIAWHDRHRDDRAGLYGLALGLIVFGAGSLLAVSIGRFQAFSPDEIESRYSTFALHFYAGGLILFFLVATRTRAVGRLTGTLRLSLLVACVVMIVAARWGDGLLAQHGANMKLAQARIEASLDLSTALPDRAELAGEIHTVPVRELPALLAGLEKHGLRPADRWSRRPGRDLRTAEATGNVDDRIVHGESVTLRGWARLPTNRPADCVLALVRDDDGSFVPVAMSEKSHPARPDVAARFADPQLLSTGWVMELTKDDAARRPVVVAYSASDGQLYLIPFYWS